MKKRFVLYLLPFLSLASCNLFELSGDSYNEGFSDGGDHSARTVEFFNGDNTSILTTEGHTAHEITFKSHEHNDQPELKTEEDVMKVVVDNDNFVTGVENISNVNQLYGLKVGNLSDTVDGSVTFRFADIVVGCEIYARPRCMLTTSNGVIVWTVDDKVALSANGSKYISINCNYTNDEDIQDTKCCYLFTGPTLKLDLNVAFQRLEIMKIVVYEANE